MLCTPYHLSLHYSLVSLLSLNQRMVLHYTTEELRKISSLEALSVILHYRGNRIKHKMTNILQEEQYITLITNREGRNHQWFKKAHLELNKNPPTPQYTKNRTH